MTGYVCKRCPLAFAVGYYVYGDLSGGCVMYVCRHCGTMHRTVHLKRQPDMLFALPGPIRSMVTRTIEAFDGEAISMPELPDIGDSWRPLGPLPTAEDSRGSDLLIDRALAVALDRVACGHCGCVGGLVSREWPLAADGSSPSFGKNCPVCKGDLQLAYDDTIH